jgi:putative sulfurtransferase DndC
MSEAIRSKSVFQELGFSKFVEERIRLIQELYLSDTYPWIIGYSGGKDSTAILQLIWLALEQLNPPERQRQVHVISTDTMVENPIVSAWVGKSMDVMQATAHEKNLPIYPHILKPTIQDRYWVNLLGRGYPAPRQKFRWCTERLKIKPSNEFITKTSREAGQALLVLGTRKAESSTRSSNMDRHILEQLMQEELDDFQANELHSLIQERLAACENTFPSLEEAKLKIRQQLLNQKEAELRAKYFPDLEKLLEVKKKELKDQEVKGKDLTKLLKDYEKELESQDKRRKKDLLNKARKKSFVTPNSSLPNCSVFTPIEDFTNDDVWMFLTRLSNPWGYRNEDLLGMYQGATEGGECPLVVDESTPSCGDSRFGCWVCTMVEEDKSMSAMIQNDEEKQWMEPLLDFREKLRPPLRKDSEKGSSAFFDDRSKRDFRRRSGRVQLFYKRYVPGPYLQNIREEWLGDLLEIQEVIREEIQESGRTELEHFEIISMEELHEIRRIWVEENNEVEDSLPLIYQNATGLKFPGEPLIQNPIFNQDDLALLEESCSDDRIHYEMVRDLLAQEHRMQRTRRRSGLFDQLERAIKRGFFEDSEDAFQWELHRQEQLQKHESQFNPSSKALEEYGDNSAGSNLEVQNQKERS